MKRKQMVKMIWGVAAALLLASCSKEAVTEIPTPDGKGTLLISAVTMPQIAVNGQTRATDQKPTTELSSFMGSDAAKFTDAWAMSSLRTRVVCVAYDDEPLYGMHAIAHNSANDYNKAEDDDAPILTPVPAIYNVTMGMYTTTNGLHSLYGYLDEDGKPVTAIEAPEVRYADHDKKDPDKKQLFLNVPDGEGVNYIFFEGWTQTEVDADEYRKEVEVKIGMANTAIVVAFTDAFKNYFAEGATVTLKSENGLDAVITSKDTGRYFGVRSNQTITLNAEGTPQNPGTGLTADPIKFQTVTQANVEPRTLYTFTYDVRNTGGVDGTITITVNDEPVGTVDLGEIETNPNEQ